MSSSFIQEILDCLTRSGYKITLEVGSCHLKANFGENDARGVVSHYFNGDSLATAIKDAWSWAKKEAEGK